LLHPESQAGFVESVDKVYNFVGEGGREQDVLRADFQFFFELGVELAN
jgi:hypothetical protein